MSTAKTAKTAKLLNDLLDSQKVDRARIKQLEERLAGADTRQASAVTAAVREAVAAAEMQFGEQLDRMQRELAAVHDQRTGLAVHQALEISNHQGAALKQELCGVRQLLSAADASNEELRGIIDTFGDKLDEATQAAAKLADERVEITKQREELTHILDTVRERMRKRERAEENAILNRGVLARATAENNVR